MWKVENGVVGAVGENLGLLCQAAIKQLGAQRVKDQAEIKRAGGVGRQAEMWGMTVPAAMRLARAGLPEFLDIYEQVVNVAKNYLVYEEERGSGL